MKTMKRLFSLALVLALAVSALTGCGGGDGSASSADPAGSAPSDSSADPAEALDLSQITDPYLATSGLAGDTVVARAGDQDITAAQLENLLISALQKARQEGDVKLSIILLSVLENMERLPLNDPEFHFSE